MDLSHLNWYVQHEQYMSPSPVEAIADTAATNAKYFTILDAMKGYHQCPLDQNSPTPNHIYYPPLAGFKYLHTLTGYHSYQNITIATWQKPWQISLDIVE